MLLKFIRLRQDPYYIDGWYKKYIHMCETSDYEYLRHEEIKGTILGSIGQFVFLGFIYWAIIIGFLSIQTLLLVIPVTLLILYAFLYYLLYLPLDIEEEVVDYKRRVRRRQGSTGFRGFRFRNNTPIVESNVYIFESGKEATDYADRVLSLDQNYKVGQKVYLFKRNDKVYYCIGQRLSEEYADDAEESEM